MGEKLKRFRELCGEINDLARTAAVLNWDQQVSMPPGGAPARAQQLATLYKLAHEMIISEKFGAALKAASEEVASLDPDSDDARLVKRTTRDYAKAVKVPNEWVREFRITTALAFQNWHEARSASSFKDFAEMLEKIVNLRRQYSEFFAPYDHVYDPHLDFFEPDMKTAEVKAVFEKLRPQQVALVREIVEKGKPVDDSILHQKFSEKKQWDFGEMVVAKVGYDFERGRQDKAAHPFTTSFHPDDVRITTRVNPKFFSSAFFGTMHEAGHAMYEQGVDPTFARTALADGTSYGIHESQSRMFENLIGRSKPFWKAYYPKLQKVFSKQLGSVSLDDFYRAINKVEPSYIRVEADETTYNLHIMLRFDLETALLKGDLAVDDLPDAWNQKVEEYFGLGPPDDANGVLQDVHWSSGYLGYFPTYALGNLMASQLWEKIDKDIPDLETQIEKAEFGDLLAWLRENVHRHGAKFYPQELLKRATGSELDPEPYMRYLRRKYSEIYAL
jgi:carboxypeptidase Taq